MRIAATTFFVLLLSLFAGGPGRAQPIRERIAITTDTGSHPFDAELVRATADLEKGLMFRRSMADDHGMLFDFKAPRNVMMWMKNTYIALDMVFIDSKGRVVSVAENTVPMSEAIISSGAPALGVLEINAGVARKIDLKPGDIVDASIFPR